MSARLRHRRNLITVAEYSRATGEKPDTVRRRIHRGTIVAVNLNEGTGKRPRWRIYGRELRKAGRG